MTRTPLDELRDHMRDAPDELDESRLPFRFREARSVLLQAISQLENDGIPNETLVTVMLAEMLPRMVHQNGPAWAAATLAKLAENIGAGSSPAGSIQ